MSDPTKYNNLGRQMTGFNSENEKTVFGHWSNPEYQAVCQSQEMPVCETCRGNGCIESDYGVAICVDCCVGIPLSDALVIVRDYPDCESFVCAHYEFYSNGMGDNSSDLAKYWQRCQEIVKNANELPY